MRALVALLYVVLLLPACREGGPASPSGRIRSILVVAGDTGQPVPGARVFFEGAAYTSGPTGEVLLDDQVTGGHRLRVDSEGFLVRETLTRSGQEAIGLWPVRGTYSDVYVRALLYKPSDTTRTEPSPRPDEPLMRVVARQVSVVPSPEIRQDPLAMAAHQQAVDAINRATGGQVIFTLDASPAAPVTFRMVIDPSSPDGAFTYRTLRDGAIVGGRVVFSQREGFHPVRDVRYVAHELGHVLGLQHSIVPTDMMYFTTHDESPYTFTAAEELTIRLLLQRAPGNQYPDRDGRLG